MRSTRTASERSTDLLWRSHCRYGGPTMARSWLRVREGGQVQLPDGYCVAVEDGSVARPDEVGPLPVGIHEVLDGEGRPVSDLVVIPAILSAPRRSWGWNVLLRALRSRESWGCGDLHDLQMFAAHAAAVGAGYIFLGPTKAASVGMPREVSPYSPSSRLFDDPLYLRPEDVAGWDLLDADVRSAAARAWRLDAEDRVDLDAVRALKLPALRALYDLHVRHANAAERAELACFRTTFGDELERVALHGAIEAEYGARWTGWPTELREPSAAGRSAFAANQACAVEFQIWCQWQLDRQLRTAAAQGVGLIRDLPVGTPLFSADAWLWQDCVATEWELGAPPDYFNPDGHAWGLVPYRPGALRRARFRPFRLALRATLRHAAGIRIDHALGLLQQFWIPRGQLPTAGRYVVQDTAMLLDVICVEAHRADAFVTTEELGTPPPQGTEALRERGFLPYAVITSDEFTSPSRNCVIAATTHDLPTVPGCWTGADLRMLKAAGIAIRQNVAERARQRIAACAAVDEETPVDEVVERLYRALAMGPSALLMVSLEDALGVRRRPNVPGAPPERWPSFVQALPVPLPDLLADAQVARLAVVIGAHR